jgi:hypothetical protein
MNSISNVALIDLDRPLDDDLVLHLVGPLRLLDRSGADLTPRARKAQGMLALLGTSPGLRRSRAWLQDKLWSDRGAEQGAGSLRQCLTDIRTALGPHVGCLRTEPGWVGLDPARVRVRAELTDAEALEGVEFLEGLDIRDPEFEHWIRDQRLHCQQRTSRLGGARRRLAVGLAIRRPPHGSADEEAVGDLVLDQVAHALLGFANVDVVDFRAECAAHAEPDWLIDVTASVWRSRSRVTLRLFKCRDGLLLWTDARTFDLADFYEPEPAAVDAFAGGATWSAVGRMRQAPGAELRGC